LVFQTIHLLHVPVNDYLIGFVFCATIASYNFHYILAGAIGQQKLSWSLFSRRPTATFLFLAAAGCAAILFFPSRISMAYALFSVFLTIIYSVPLLPYKQLDVARKAGLLKTILLAFTWTFVTAYLPIVQQGLPLSTLGLLILAKRFLFMLLLCIIFDSRDVNIDRVNGLHSLATDLSPKFIQRLIFIVFVCLFILNFYFGKHGVTSRQVIALQCSSLAALLVYFLSLKKQGYFFYYFIVDGMMILMTALTTIASI
jgi:4-hydroxybenzoate polyprenyltransferase